jgi:hypothetical protein
MRALPANFYRDPLEVAMAREARTCKGCVHEQAYELANQKIKICARGRPHGRGCKLFREKT